ncbi:DUF58 domain-containing protein [Microbacterium jiangjiandongii]|uniref:DUF58 domain-containing protein n=1 Tax=Microbacterium jiangjiandongii TaxID=3049071 RepID=UPI00214CEFBF|nr:DUF58 domain-containing protein [Microbacterium sp. zg.Y843]MCR2816355.1 DUF58 domain-containing protein [Microbacterium sp. zg.Y843]
MTAAAQPAAPALVRRGVRRARAVPRTSLRARYEASVAPAVAPLARRLGRITRVVTPLGWGIIAVTVVAGAAGMTLGWWELTTLALCGAALLAVCAVFLIGRTQYDVSLDLTRQRVVVGERAVGSLELRNPGTRAILPARVILPVGQARPVFEVPRLPPGASHDDLFAIPTTRRAVLTVGPVSAVRGDPLGVFQRVQAWSDPLELFVHPHTVGLGGMSAGFLRDLEGLPTRDLSRDDVSFHALREYAPGDDRRHVHWRSSARTGTLMVRQFEDTRRSHIVVTLSRNAGEYADPDEFELAVSAAGSVAVQALRDDRDVSVLSQDESLPTTAGRPLLDALSRIETAHAVASTTELAARVKTEALQASIVVMLAGSRVSPQALRAAARTLPGGARVLGVSCRVGATPELRRLGDATILTLGALSDLPVALRRVLA